MTTSVAQSPVPLSGFSFPPMSQPSQMNNNAGTFGSPQFTFGAAPTVTSAPPSFGSGTPGLDGLTSAPPQSSSAKNHLSSSA